ncbi:ferritin-like domain-containing protein [Catalinimonas niigatensis]|uniref:ferritin-like domain-containing protein n=1 Tax=Catalinimonas niigatensis TaxID=1397264 RepID=UPI002666233F|nr:ferritin-like domain-containing protein [Catalinimonas niigatensis]WPP51709.1 ferritin-like domain-containing protein [Catalinimonas niigatensis]
MTIFNVLDRLNKKDLEIDQLASRREVFNKLGNLGKKLALGSVPVGLAAVTSSKAYASSEKIANVLNFALLLEYLEAEFYVLGLDSGVIPAGSDAEKIYMQISKHETAHVEFLKSAINSIGGDPIEKPGFDFTVGGAFDTFGNYDVFLILSQAFEDTGVRAYKGQAANLIDSNDILTAALQIHSVEARHASEVRRLRSGQKGWVTQDGVWEGMPSEVRAVYAGEDNTVQGGLELTAITDIDADAITEAYDEPLSKEEVTAIASLFLV